MTKIYLVNAQGCEENGRLDITAVKYVKFVFTNKKLAENCAYYLNENWREGVRKNKNFKKEFIFYYYVEIRTISKTDYSKLPY